MVRYYSILRILRCVQHLRYCRIYVSRKTPRNRIQPIRIAQLRYHHNL